MLDTQKAQIELLSRLMSATETLTTKEELTEYMNEQLNILTENNAQCQAAVTEFQNKMRKSAAEFTDSMKTAVSDTEKRVGRISDYYSNNLSMLTDTAEKYLSRIFWITVIPSAITALYYLTLLILRLIYYADDGYSGTNFNRPEFKRMMGDIEMGKINLVLTKDLSRLGRNHILTGQYTDIIFPQYDVRYIAVGDGVDTLYDDNDIAPFKNVLNEMYARDISKKQRASMANRRANGLFTGNLPPYGYLIDPEKKHRFIVDETAAKVVRHIFDLALQGYGGRAIGTMLQHEKVLRPSYHYAEVGLKCGTLPAEKYIWHEQTIRKMLHDPTYTGAMVGNKRPTVSFQLKKRVKSSPDELVIIEDMHEPIISKEDFETVQRMLERRHKEVDLVPKGVLNGVLKCAECGKTMSRNSKKNGKDREFYCCRTYRNHGRSYCTHHFLSSIDAQKMVLASIREKARLALKDDGNYCRSYVRWRWTSRPPTAKR